MLDYDKKFLVEELGQPDLRRIVDPRLYCAEGEPICGLGLDWSAFYWAPADVFGPGKRGVLVFGEVIDKNGGTVTAGTFAAC